MTEPVHPSLRIEALEKEVKAARKREDLLLRRMSKLEASVKVQSTENAKLRGYLTQLSQKIQVVTQKSG